MANNNEQVNINLVFKSNADATTNDVDALGNSLKKVEDNTNNTTKATNSHTNSLKSNSHAVLENGGAMGLLNDLTGGYAMMVKDAVEASALFTNAKKTDTIATEANMAATEGATVATTSWTTALLANPLVAVAALVVGLTAGIYLLSKAFITNTDYATKNLEANAKLTKAYSQQAKQLVINYEAQKLQHQNDIKLLEAQGKSKKVIDETTEAYNNQAVAIAKINQIKAIQAFNDQREYVQQLVRIGKASDETIASEIKTAGALKEKITSATEVYRDAYAQRKQDRIDATIKDAEIQTKAVEKTKTDAVDAEKTKNDAILEERKKYAEKTKFDDDAIRKAVVDADNKAVEDKKTSMIKDLENKAAISQQLVDEQKNRNEQLAQLYLDDEMANKALTDAKIGFGISLSDSIGQIAGKNKGLALGMLAVSKGLAIAEVVVGASRSIANATANLASTPAVIGVVPNPMYAVQAAATAKGIITTKLAAAASIASIVASTITSAKSISGGESGGATASTAVTAGTAPSTRFISSRDNQLADTISGAINDKPTVIKTYVTSKDVTTAQELDRNAISSTTIG